MNRLPLVMVLVSLAACEKSTPEAAPGNASGSRPPATPTAQPVTSVTTVAAEAAEDSFIAFAKLINEASEAVLLAARGRTTDARWGLEPRRGSRARPLRGAKRLFTTAKIEAVSKTHGYLRTSVVVLPDNRVRWIGLAHHESATVSATDNLDVASAVLAAAAKSLVNRLSGNACALPLLSEVEALAVLGLKKEYSDVQPRLSTVCKVMKSKTDGWVPRYDSFIVMVDVEGEVVMIGSRIRVVADQLVLETPSVH